MSARQEKKSRINYICLVHEVLGRNKKNYIIHHIERYVKKLYAVRWKNFMLYVQTEW